MTTGVGLKLNSGEIVPVSAMEVFQAAYGAARVVGGISVGNPMEDLPSLRFSRFPAEPAVRVADGDRGVTIEVGVSAGAAFVPLTARTDQVISGEEWFPVQSDALDVLTRWVADLEGVSGSRGNLASLIALRTRPDMPGKLFDDVHSTSISLASQSTAASGSIEGLHANLYPYQAEGVGFLKMVAEQGVGCVLADEMGLGKTLQVIALLLSERNAGRGPSLVVVPATLLENWRREMQLFAPSLRVHIHAGAARPGVAAALIGVDVVVVSYETAIRDEALFDAVSWNVVALDEAQNIKNPEAQRSCVVKRMRRRVSVAVTGTPLENHLDDLWSVTDFALPGLLGSISQFRDEYAEDADDAARLGSLIAPVVLRRRVIDVAKDLPEKIEIPQALRMTRRLAEAYERIRLETLAEYGAAGNLVATSKLRMLCAHPQIVSSWDLDPTVEMPKFVRLLEILDEVFAAGEKALVFSTYTAIADLFMSEFSRRYPGGFFRHIDGRVPVSERQPTVDQFFSSKTYGALFLNPKAAGAGLNITAANHVIHYNPEWNPALTDQATARAYRRKQNLPVTVHYLYFLGTVEEVIVDRAAFKRQLAGEAVTGHGGDIEPSAIARALQISPLANLEDVEQ